MSQPDSHQLIEMLLDAIERENRGRPDFAHAVARNDAAMLLERVAGLYAAAAGSSASIYAMVALQDVVKALFKSDHP